MKLVAVKTETLSLETPWWDVLSTTAPSASVLQIFITDTFKQMNKQTKRLKCVCLCVYIFKYLHY